MQMNDVGLLKLPCSGDISTCVGYGDLPQITAAKQIVYPNNETFPDEVQLIPNPTVMIGDIKGISLFLHYQHLGFDTVVDQCLGQPMGSNGCPTLALARIDYQNSHGKKLLTVIGNR